MQNIGEPLEDFSLHGANGETISLGRSLAGKNAPWSSSGRESVPIACVMTLPERVSGEASELTSWRSRLRHGESLEAILRQITENEN